ncbi:ribonuclease P protein component [Sphingobacterium sp. UME9]|uniref:ribonuclease P protein component n=1 Tax=Sphingobacterium sp. UME9 TaxID=1862316 RepID=UPI00160236FB|nr:ribonuclease P protein component [Sphingobacterium sp. UME9]MBB1644551.1 hypothetical protein [Sphingobacterium sp. UME9]
MCNGQVKISYKFGKDERLSSKKRINQLFTKGKSFIAFPLRVIYAPRSDESMPPVSVLVNVPKRKIKIVPKRNKVKRLIREAYRLNKHKLIEQIGRDQALDLAFLYLHNEPLSFREINDSVLKAIAKIKVYLGEK